MLFGNSVFGGRAGAIGCLIAVAGCHASSAQSGSVAIAPPPDPAIPVSPSPPLGSSPPQPPSSSLPPPIAATSATIPPSPLISRGRPVRASSPVNRFDPPASAVVDSEYGTFRGTWVAGRPSLSNPAWVAIDVGAGPTRLLVEWTASASYNYQETDYGSPDSYRIEMSADSTDGSNGAWKTVAIVSSVSTHAGENAFDFKGGRWVRFVVTGVPAKSPNGVHIDEIDVFDTSKGSTDTWFFMGDSITAFAFDRHTPEHQPTFAELVHAKHPDYFPAMINGGIGGEQSKEGVAHIDEWLRLNPDFHYWALCYGTNDASGDARDTATFKRNVQTIIDRVRAAGRVPILGRIPFASDNNHPNIPMFNLVIDELTMANGLIPGPDLYAWFLAHPEQLRDGLHPTDAGIVAINRLWASAMERLYPR
jgi:acyl-CoA thioesterase-1